jgi:hypothetical protein
MTRTDKFENTKQPGNPEKKNRLLLLTKLRLKKSVPWAKPTVVFASALAYRLSMVLSSRPDDVTHPGINRPPE